MEIIAIQADSLDNTRNALRTPHTMSMSATAKPRAVRTRTKGGIYIPFKKRLKENSNYESLVKSCGFDSGITKEEEKHSCFRSLFSASFG